MSDIPQTVGDGAGSDDTSHHLLFLQRLAGLREKLLDLSNRNRLVSFKHSDRSRTHVRVIDELPDVLFAKLRTSSMRFKSLPEPESEPPDEDSAAFLNALEAARRNDETYRRETAALGGRASSSPQAKAIDRALRDRVREKLEMPPWTDQSTLSKEEFARLQGLEPAYLLPKPVGNGADPDRHLDDEIQTLLFPREMDTKLRGIVDQARTMAQEAGVSTLRAAFGFLEWCEADHSETRHLSPLVLLPVEIRSRKAHPWRRYDISGGQSEVETNTTLWKRLERDFGFDPPTFTDDDTPESYLDKIEQAIIPQPKWRVRRYVTIGNFGFSKLAMYTDLDPEFWSTENGFGAHDLIRRLLLGENRADSDPFDAPDYEIDSPEIDAEALLQVTDADASQHSALVDAARGKNLAIMGPPGTGKSQTITNLIAASLAAGKKVLFVAEKMAALEVVHSRLTDAGLGEFCLEVHSSKTSKAMVLDSLKRRLDLQNKVPAPAEFKSRLQELRGVRDRLNEYVKALNEPVGALGNTVHQVLWRERRARDRAGPAWDLLRGTKLSGVPDLTPAEHAEKRQALSEALSRIPELAAARSGLRAHPWAWVRNPSLTALEVDDAQPATHRWSETVVALTELAERFTTQFGAIPGVSCDHLARLAEAMGRLPGRADPLVAKLTSAIGDEATLTELADFARQASSSGEATSAAVTMRELPPPAVDWIAWSDTSDAALADLNALADGPDSLEEATKVLSRMRDRVARLAQLHTLALAIGRAAGYEGAPSVAFAQSAARSAELLAQLPRERLALRRGPLFEEGAEARLSRALDARESLRAQRLALESTFVLSPMPPFAEVETHARTLRTAGPFAALSPAVWRAKRFFRAIAQPGTKAKTPEVRQGLARLATFLEAREAIRDDSGLATLCGPWFEGAATPFEALAEVQQWGRRVRAALPAHAEDGALLREWLLAGETEVLEGIAGQSTSLTSAVGAGLLDELDTEESTLADLCAQCEEDLERLDHAIRTLSEQGFNPDASPARIASLTAHVRALDTWRVMVRATLADLAVQPIPLTKVAEAVGGIQPLQAAGLSFDTVAQVLRGDARDGFARAHEWANDVRSALQREAAERSHVVGLLHVDSEALAGAPAFAQADLTALSAKLRDAITTSPALSGWANYLRAKRRAAELGLGALMEPLEAQEVSADQGVAAYDELVFRQLVALAHKRLPILDEFDGVGIQQARERFRQLDRDILGQQRRQIRADLCRARVPAGNGVGLKRDFTELALIYNEQAKKRGHIPLRDLFDRAAGAVRQLKPCLMMSPLSVATYLRPGALSFDLIVIDEASQMPPEDAIGALVRAGQCVVVGDPKQLPPTSFFQRFEEAAEIDDDEEDDGVSAESILDQAHNILLPPRKLRWHYRSRHQSLIAFSNRWFYENGLTVFPSPAEAGEKLGVRLVQVDGPYADRCNPTEVQKVAEWALDFMTNPANRDRSLGIVAVNQSQREQINDEMDHLFETHSSAGKYRDRWEKTLTPFIVKNLENVQGDERDVIAISTVYGRNAEGRPTNNFGPISKRNGHRRLNVLFTRAREQVVLFTSLRPEDITIRETTPEGPRALRAYLNYALTGRLAGGEETGRAPDSDFEVSVASRLTALGYEVEPQLGVAGFFIDLAVRHPEFPGTYLLGVECDGATYHSARSARDRDRLREEVLNRLGWKLYRVWSTDWFRDADRETEKLRAAIEQAAEDRRLAYAETQAPPDEELDSGPEVDAAAPDGTSWGAEEDEPDRPASDRIGDLATAERASADMDVPLPPPAADVVEINDRVSFRFVDRQEPARTLRIVLGDGRAEEGTINSHSPIGEALLGASVGDDVEIYTPGGVHTAIVEKIVKVAAPQPVTREVTTQDGVPDRLTAAVAIGQSDVSAAPETRQGELPLGRAAPSLRGAAPGEATPQPYRRWEPTPLPDPRETEVAEIADHLREIIEIEGPIRVRRAYRLYANACGINRVGRAVRAELNKALHRLSKLGEVSVEREGADETQISATVRVAGAPRVIVRTAGGRDFWDVPPSELASVMEAESTEPYVDSSELYRRVLERYGLVRLTSGIQAELDRIRTSFLERR